MTLMIKPAGDGHFTIDDGTLQLDKCPHCLQAMDERTAVGLLERVNQGDWTLEQLIKHRYLMESVTERAIEQLTAITMKRQATVEEIHAITSPLRIIASSLLPGKGHTGGPLLEGGDHRH